MHHVVTSIFKNREDLIQGLGFPQFIEFSLLDPVGDSRPQTSHNNLFFLQPMTKKWEVWLTWVFCRQAA